MTVSRRGVLIGASLAAASTVAGCSTTAIPFDATVDGAVPHSEKVPTPSEAPNGQKSAIQVASTAEIPVGGGLVVAKDNIVITQPAAGDFKAFSAVCPHVGCLLDKVENGTINCPCHGSKFKITDGSVVTGPAPTALAAKTITVTNGKILLQ